MKCTYCDEQAVTNLDGDDLCNAHANEWVKSEGRAIAERDELAKHYPGCGGEGWFKADDGAIVTCYGHKCH